jgi:hypothetical protein
VIRKAVYFLLCILLLLTILVACAKTKEIVPLPPPPSYTQGLATITPLKPMATEMPATKTLTPPTNTPTTATVIVSTLPEGWKIYESAMFSIGYPPEWIATAAGVAGHENEMVTFNLPNSLSLLVAYNDNCVCGLNDGSGSKAVQECLANSADWGYKGEEYQLLDAGEWWDGVHKGDYVEYINGSSDNGTLTRDIRIIALVSNKGCGTIEAFFNKEGNTSYIDTEREQLRNAISSFQLSPEE